MLAELPLSPLRAKAISRRGIINRGGWGGGPSSAEANFDRVWTRGTSSLQMGFSRDYCEGRFNSIPVDQTRPIPENREDLRASGRIAGDPWRAAGHQRGNLLREALDGLPDVGGDADPQDCF